MKLLRFDGVNDQVNFTASSTNWGTGTYTIEIGMVVRAFPDSGNQGIIGSSASTTTGVALRQLSGDGALAVLTSGTFRFASAADLVILNEYHVYRLEHDAGGVFRWYRDGVQFGAAGTFSTSASGAVHRFGVANSNGGFSSIDLSYAEFTGFSVSARWEAELANDTGSVLPSVGEVNNGTLVNFPTDDSQWITVSGETNISFSGPVPVQQLTQGTLYTRDLAPYFFGSRTPFTYAVQSGSLPTGVTLNGTTGVLSGTPTVQGKFPSVVVRGTDTGSNTADTNAFNVGVGPWALRFTTDAQRVAFSSWTVPNDADFEIEFSFIRTTGTAYLLYPPSGSFSHSIRLNSTTLTFRIAGNDFTMPLPNANGSASVLRITRISNFISVVHNGTSLGTLTGNASGMTFGLVGLADTNGSRMDLSYFRLLTAGDNRTYRADVSDVFQSAVFSTEAGTNNGTMFSFAATAWVNVALPVTAALLKYHNGTSWVAKPLKYHNGTSWVAKPLKRHNGTNWS